MCRVSTRRVCYKRGYPVSYFPRCIQRAAIYLVYSMLSKLANDWAPIVLAGFRPAHDSVSGQSGGSACSVATSAIARRTAPTPGLEVGARMMNDGDDKNCDNGD